MDLQFILHFSLDTSISQRKVRAYRYKIYNEKNFIAAVESVRNCGHLNEREAAVIYNISKSTINQKN